MAQGVRVLGITIEKAVFKNRKRRITNKLKIERELKYFFRNNRFYAEYDRRIADVPLGIRNIPAVSSVIHFAWAVGCDVTVGELDETYLKGLEEVKKIFMKTPAYRFLSFEGELNVGKVTDSEFETQDRSALLFSGGIDSTASYISRKPEQLISIWGLDVPTHWWGFWRQIMKTYAHLHVTPIKTNTLELYSNSLYELGKEISAGYYAGFAYSIITFGVCPPATVNNVDSVMMASTFPLRYYGNPDYPFQNYKPHYYVDQHLGWANIKTLDVENDHDRPEKIRTFIKPHFEEQGSQQIRVCGHLAMLKVREDKSKLNCSYCDKCQVAIASLSNFDIDPNICGFNVHDKTFTQIKNNIVSKRFVYVRQKYFWENLKKNLNREVRNDFHGSREFLEWLGEYQL